MPEIFLFETIGISSLPLPKNEIFSQNIMTQNNLIDIPNQFDSTCFGCSPNNPVGLKMNFKAGDDFVLSELKIPQHLCGWNNLAHGGVLSTILDEIMSWTAIYFMKSLVMTKSMKIDFLKSVSVGDTINAVGRIKERRNSHEVVMAGSIINENQKECAKSEAVFALLSNKLASRLGITSEELPDWLK